MKLLSRLATSLSYAILVVFVALCGSVKASVGHRVFDIPAGLLDQSAYSGDREQSFHAMVNGTWSRQLESQFLREVFTIRQAGAMRAECSG
jgi:hypothetical protein